MAYTVTFYSFSKRHNSTAQPTTGGTDVNCKLKDGSGILSPVIVVDFSNIPGVSPQNFNMAYIAEFSRYYKINNTSYIMGLWEYSLSVDVLASWKTAIGDQSLYVLRAASNYDGDIVDNTYPIKTGVTYLTEQNNSNPFDCAFSNGYFVVGIINADSAAYGATAYYVFTNAEFRAFSSYLLGGTAYWGVTEISDQLLKCLYNPFQYIVSCTWMPIAPGMGTALTQIPLGWWLIPANCHRLSGYVRSGGTKTVSIPKHPDAATRPYLKNSPFSQYYLDFPPFGSFSIPAENIANASTLDFYYDVDCITGVGRLQIGADYSAKPFNIVHGQIGVPISLAQLAPDIAGMIQQNLPATKYDWVNDMMATVTNIGSAMLAQSMPMQTTGGMGGFSAGSYPIKLTGMFVNTAPENITEFGRPCCKTVTIRTLSGFVQCAHADFQIPALEPEIEEIGNYLTGGFFYE